MPPLWTTSFVRITAVQFLTFSSFQLVTPILPVYLSLFTSSEAVIGSTVGAFTVSAVVVRLWMGPVVDEHGRAAPLIHGLWVFAAVTALHALTRSAESVLVARLLHGAAFAAVTTAVGAMGADVIPARRRAEGMSIFGSSVTLAQTVGPAAGFALVELWGFHPTFVAGAAVALIALVLARTQPETRPAVAAASGTAARVPGTAQVQPRLRLERGALVPAAVVLAAAMAFGGLVGLVPLYAAAHGVANPGIVYSVLALALLLVRLVVGRLADRWGAAPLAGAGLALSAVGLWVLAAWPDAFGIAGLPGGILAGAALYGLGHGSVTPVAQGVSIARVHPSRWGSASATFFSFLDLGIGLGAAFLGVVAQIFSLGTMYRLAAGLPLVGLAVLAATHRSWTLAGKAGETGQPGP